MRQGEKLHRIPVVENTEEMTATPLHEILRVHMGQEHPLALRLLLLVERLAQLE